MANGSYGIRAGRGSEYWNFSEKPTRLRKDGLPLDMSLKQVQIYYSNYENSEQWKIIAQMPELEELSLIDPKPDIVNLIPELSNLKRLHIDGYRNETIDFLLKLPKLEELCIEYSSRFKNLDSFANLGNLKALKLHNLRKIQDFSGLAGLGQLKHLIIDSQFDYAQPIESFSFLEAMSELEHLELGRIRSLTKTDTTIPFRGLKALKYLKLPSNVFSLRDYALLDVLLPGHIDRPEPIERLVFIRQGMADGLRKAPLPSDLSSDQYEDPIVDLELGDHGSDLLALFSGIADAVQNTQGLKKAGNDNEGQHKIRIRSDYFHPLGKGARKFRAKDKNANKKVLAHIEKYEALKSEMSIYVQSL